ncbi:MAG TPA: homoserine O-succinyltransferase [Alphaproteobacteria bacterium]|nr:homoserine O-succinyltransferase [Alphaproteobacteria bacterium]HNS44066.1 homoserine O-succinyltransferase [Alphaproteobacteria bacterium]
MSQRASGLTSASSFSSATHQNAPRIALINIMDNAEGTERHFLNTLHLAAPNAQITLCRMACAKSDAKYFREREFLLSSRYQDWQDVIGHQHFDLVIVTGIDRGRLTYNDMNTQYTEFWNESRDLFQTLRTNIRDGSVNHASLVCWSAFAAMKELYGVEKGIHEEKFYGLFDHTIETPSHPLARGLGDGTIVVPQSRYSFMEEADLRNVIGQHNGEVVMNGPDGPAIWTLENRKMTCFINHLEYRIDTLAREYERGKKAAGPDFPPPQNYDANNVHSRHNEAAFDHLSNACASFYRNMIALSHNEKREQKCEMRQQFAHPKTFDIGKALA